MKTMRAISNFISSTGSFEPVFRGGGRERPLTVVRRARARGMRLTVDPRDATIRLTLPPRTPLKSAVAWAAGKRLWVEEQMGRMPPPQPIVPDMEIPLGGETVVLDWSATYPRRPELKRGRLIVGGPREQLAPRVLRFLRAHALATLERETRVLAASQGMTVGRVAVGDAKGRWGSCTSAGDIRYSWRLILAPAFVRHSTVAHEVAHRVHMNHGPAFHALASSLLGADPAPARTWLRAHGNALHWFGRD